VGLTHCAKNDESNKETIIENTTRTEESIRLNQKINSLYAKVFSNENSGVKELGDSALKLSEKLEDISSSALIAEYLGFYYKNRFENDSAFYYYNKAKIFYSSINTSGEGKMFLNLATIQEYEKDYIGSEINSIKAISLLKQSANENVSLYLSYNNLGVVYSNLNKFDEAIKFHLESLNFLDKIENTNFYSITLNNIGQAYKRAKNYSKAIEYFNKGIKESNDKFTLNAATLLDNKAYTLFKLGSYTQLPKLFYDALAIRDSLNIKDGQVESNLHLSEFFAFRKDTILAKTYAEKAKTIAEEANYNDGLLNSYKLLADLNTGQASIAYLNKHIQLTDSLQQKEREIRDKFTRIAYETDEVIKEKEVLTRKNWWITTIGSLIILLGGVIFFYFRQRAKNKELKLVQDQDQANIKIYNLMLNQQKEFQKGTEAERNRISRELHDGVLSKMFGARLSLDGLNESSSPEDIEERELQIEKLRLIEEEVRSLSHNLKSVSFKYTTKFSKLIEELLVEQSELGLFRYNLKIDKSVSFGELENEIKINIYRIIQEALFNITKYAKAKNVKVSFIEEYQKLALTITDDGVGFNMKMKAKGIGLNNMMSRSKDMGADFKIESKLNKGTTIKVIFSLDNKI